jgi:riboflavin kinase
MGSYRSCPDSSCQQEKDVNLLTGHDHMEITGVIETGVGKGAFFTNLDWVVEQIERNAGFKPYPGTLNIRVCDEDLAKLDALFACKDFELVPDDPQFCTAGARIIRINGIPAMAVFPGEDVHVHGREVIEIITSCHVKDTFHLKDGDQVTITDFGAAPSK